jgi:hypothetical protein
MPEGVQNLTEYITEFIRDLAKTQIGEEEYLSWVPFLGTIFLFVFVSNWSGALEKEEALKILKGLDKEILYLTDQNLIKEFLFGNDKYKKWTGYSVGYWLVKKFIEENKKLSWKELMELEKNKFLEVIK